MRPKKEQMTPTEKALHKVVERLQEINRMYPFHPVSRDLRCMPTEVGEEERVLELEKFRLEFKLERRLKTSGS
jgi:hypothetical protein